MLIKIEENQAGLYAVAIILGGVFGLYFSTTSEEFEILIEPALALMLYVMFVQIPFFKIRGSIQNYRFLTSLLVLNFLFLPVLVWLLTLFLPDIQVLLLGVCLVLLTPCIDYVIVFTSLGRGDAKLILAATPFLLIIQMLLLPLYLWIILDASVLSVVSVKPFLTSFLILIAVPLLLALCTQMVSKYRSSESGLLVLARWMPVPMMALVLFFIISSQIDRVHSFQSLIVWAVPVYIAFALLSLLLGKGVSMLFKLKTLEARTLIFSGGTRNSLVVLALALALPEEIKFQVAAVIVTQTIVELISELFYIPVIPGFLVPDPN